MKNGMKLALIATGLMALSGCQLTREEPYTGDEVPTSQSSSSVMGCAAGGLAGTVVAPGGGTAIGCIGGAIVAGIEGVNLDAEAEALRSELVGTGVQVSKEEGKLTLVMESDLAFGVDSKELSYEAKPTLRSVAKVMKEFGDVKLSVTGHADASGKEVHNQKLSQERADEVARYIASHGVGYSRIKVEGAGESQPICDNETSQGKACNRRVELQFYK
ncbi:OmpA family protein [Vibrio parahaemolyticus]|uniref:OmpA family protein n=2 Tax=Vibrionaceae TaxID=641 RepID=UPI000E32D1ED|nr:OmpA family protein [Vibrio parahaemolyticus]MEA5356748.1 OmpA family protein [Vibrio parahaemolyticus]RFD37445.1 OmpA family lipoprotein [Vibrio parahaemolyticus]HAT8518302.1 OmpA family protein [Vibrio vulnificus]